MALDLTGLSLALVEQELGLPGLVEQGLCLWPELVVSVSPAQDLECPLWELVDPLELVEPAELVCLPWPQVLLGL